MTRRDERRAKRGDPDGGRLRLLTRHRANTGPAATVVQVWGPEPIGGAQVEGIMARAGALLAGHTQPNPAGWGIAGQQESTDQQIWASPQAFNGGGAQTALAAWQFGAAKPTVYPQDAAMANIVLPGPGGI